MLTPKQELWFKMVEYKILFNNPFDIEGFLDIDIRDFILFMNDSVFDMMGKNQGYIFDAITKKKSLCQIVEDFVVEVPLSANYYPRDLVAVEEYYFGISSHLFVYYEVYFVEFVCRKSFLYMDKLIRKLDSAIKTATMSPLDLFLYAC